MSEQSELLEMYGQHPVMPEYIIRGYIKTKQDAEMLHMFFSPCNAPMGLTGEQILICRELYTIRLHQKKAYSRKFNPKVSAEQMRKWSLASQIFNRAKDEGIELSDREVERTVGRLEKMLGPAPDILVDFPCYPPPILPHELFQSPMTQEHFQIGMEKFIEQAFKFK